MAKSSTTWKPGIPSPNPGGRPKRDWTFAQLYEEELEKQLPTTDGTTLLAKHAVVKRIVRMAVEGDIAAIKELTARLDGQPKQSMEMDGGVNPDGTRQPIQLLVNVGGGFIPATLTVSTPPTSGTPADAPKI